VTNGFMVNEEVVEKLNESGMKTVAVSIDDLGEKHDQFRHMPHAYERAINAVKLLGNSGYFDDVQITTTITKETLPRLHSMLLEFEKLPINSWRLMSISPIGRANGNKDLLLNKDEINLLLDFIKKYRPRYKSKFEITYNCEDFLGIENELAVRSYFFECKAGVNVASILHDGEIFACPNIPEREKLSQGNVRRDRFKEVWENGFRYFRDPEFSSNGQCPECEFRKYCNGGSKHLTGKPCFTQLA
jgi:radical SAM protein with 4Fe4S-binding SPASM domain